MGRISFRRFYTETVEHFFRMAIRNDSVKGDTPLDWFLFTKSWLGTQEESDREFLEFIFRKDFRTPMEGIYCYLHEKDDLNRLWLHDYQIEEAKKRLTELERAFAIAGELITEETTGFERY